MKDSALFHMNHSHLVASHGLYKSTKLLFHSAGRFTVHHVVDMFVVGIKVDPLGVSF